MNADNLLAFSAFLAASSFIVLVFTLVSGRKNRVDARLDDLSNEGNRPPVPEEDAVKHLARTTIPKMGAPLLPHDQEGRSRLRARLHQAGLYSPQAMLFFLGVKMLM